MSSASRQGSCGHPMDDADDHELCFECLGTGHVMADCPACLAYNIETYNKRSMRLALWCCYQEGAKPPTKHSLAHYTRQLAKFQHTDPGSPANRSELGDPESDREGSRDPPAIIPASGGLDGSVGRAAAVGAHPLDPPGIQRSSGLGGALGNVPETPVSVAPGAQVLVPSSTQGLVEQAVSTTHIGSGLRNRWFLGQPGAPVPRPGGIPED